MVDISTTLMNVKWDKKEPAKLKAVQQLINSSIKDLPDEHLAFFLYSDGGDGTLGIEPGWFQ